MGISERYNGTDIEPGLSAPAIEIPSTVDESSSGGRGRDASLPAVKFLQAFFDLLSSNCKSQVADSPVYEPSRCISPLMCAALWPQKLVLFPTNDF